MNTFFKLNQVCESYLMNLIIKDKQITTGISYPLKSSLTRLTIVTLSVISLLLPLASDASVGNKAKAFFNQIGDNSDAVWRNPMYATLYVPAITWHNRYLYDKADTDRYNERPYGLGFGLEREDEHSWQSLYVMAFEDSFSKIEPIAGYGYEKRFSLTQDHNWRVGLGYTLGLTARDNWYYAPIPVALPLASINYKRVSFQGTYIPGTYGNGNVFFAWLRFQIPTGQ